MNEIYNQIIEILKKKGHVFNRIYLNFIQLRISPSKVLIFDLDSGSMHVTITNEIHEITHQEWYYYAKDEPNKEITESKFKQLLKEIIKGTL